LRRSSLGRLSARSDGSIASSTSPASRNRYVETDPRSTIETLLILVPPSGGVVGTRPRIGQRTRRAISSTASASPAARLVRIGAVDPLTRRSHSA
jgi:hypothetical protein